MKAMLLAALLLAGCSNFVTKNEAGLCMRGGCDRSVHPKDSICGGCGNCYRHCIGNFFKGPNK